MAVVFDNIIDQIYHMSTTDNPCEYIMLLNEYEKIVMINLMTVRIFSSYDAGESLSSNK